MSQKNCIDILQWFCQIVSPDWIVTHKYSEILEVSDILL
jgi:hypothetical protein